MNTKIFKKRLKEKNFPSEEELESASIIYQKPVYEFKSKNGEVFDLNFEQKNEYEKLLKAKFLFKIFYK
jgi:hypothetical protein